MKTVFDWKTFLHSADERIRRGQGKQVAEDLKKISVSSLPRSSWVSFANLGRRIGLPLYSLRILQPLVRQEKERLRPANTEELTVYASLLARIGVAQEARDILNKVKSPENPEAYLFLAHLEIYSWNYKAAAVLLKKYIRLSRIQGYKKFIAEMNLLSALVAERNFLEAEPLFLKLEEQLKSQSHDLLLGNAYELAAQIALAKKNFSLARDYLGKSQNLLRTSQGVYLLYAEKWLCLVNLFERKEQGQLSPSDIEELGRIKAKALESSDWETLRDCDLYGSLLANQKDQLNFVMLGTPYSSYRYRAQALSKSRIGFVKTAVLSKSGSHKGSLLFDLQLGFCPNQPHISLLGEPKLLTCLRTLASDFYRPISMGQLHSAVYPGEFFNPDSSPQRIRNLIQRLREWSQENSIPFQIHVKNNEMKLEVGDGVELLVHQSYNDNSQGLAASFSKVKTHLGSKPFISQELAELLNISERAAKRWIASGIENGRLRIFLRKGQRAYCFI